MSAEEKKKKNKKISRMTLAEIEEKIKSTREKMGGSNSKHLQHLLKRKVALQSK